METETVDSMDGLFQSLGGCGTFQILFTLLVLCTQLPCAFSTIFMAFGAYNPGWKCLSRHHDDDVGDDHDVRAINGNNASYSYYFNETTMKTTRSAFNITTLDYFNNNNNISGNQSNRLIYHEDDSDSSCQAFTICRKIQFDPEVSSIVTEWGLVCDRSWRLSLITSLQMAGTLLGAIVVGYLGDTFGRKRTLYAGVATNALLQVPLIFSTSWQMFAGFRFVLGVCNGVIIFLPMAYISECIVQKWRSVVTSTPIWILGTVIFSVVGLILKDWRKLHAFNAGLAVICLLPMFWVPESLRWLVVKGKEEKANQVVRKITQMNKIGERISKEQLTQISDKLGNEIASESGVSVSVNSESRFSKRALVLRLFKRDKLVTSLVVGALWFTGDLVYFVTSFGVVGLPGDYFTNLIVISATDLPGNFVAAVIPNILGRKRALVATHLLLSVSLFVVVAADLLADPSQFSRVVILISIIFARTFQNIGYCVMSVYVNELYPTTVRSTANGYGGFIGTLGSVLAPFLIPTESGSLYISYLFMATAALLCSFAILPLQETKGKEMPDV